MVVGRVGRGTPLHFIAAMVPRQDVNFATKIVYLGNLECLAHNLS